METCPINKKALYDDLKEALIHYQYRLEHPMPRADESRELIIRMYLSDTFFKAKVDSLAAGIMNIIDKHI